MTISLVTRGVLCPSSPPIGLATMGVICLPLSPIVFVPSFIVGPQIHCPEVLFNKSLDLSDSRFDVTLVTPAAPTLTSPAINFSTPKEPDLFNKDGDNIVNSPESKLSSTSESKHNFNKEDPDIYDKEDPELVNDPDWKGLDECP